LFYTRFIIEEQTLLLLKRGRDVFLRRDPALIWALWVFPMRHTITYKLLSPLAYCNRIRSNI